MPESSFTPGDRVRDRGGDDDADLAVVIACPTIPADEYEIEDTGQTVADYNPDCDSDTPVVEIVFQPALEASPINWQAHSPDTLAEQIAAHDIQTYAYPATRLEQVATTPPAAEATTSPPTVTAWFDGLCEPTNPGGHGAYGIVVEVDGEIVYDAAAYLGTGGDTTMTNNVAEYEAAIAALEYVVTNYSTPDVTLKGDSQLIIRQLTGQYNVNSSRLRPLWRRAHTLVQELDATLEWVPREQNERADERSRDAYHEHVTKPAREARKQRAHQEDMTIKQLDSDRYRVKDQYVVNQNDESCTCPDYQHRCQPCKHILAVNAEISDM